LLLGVGVEVLCDLVRSVTSLASSVLIKRDFDLHTATAFAFLTSFALLIFVLPVVVDAETFSFTWAVAESVRAIFSRVPQTGPNLALRGRYFFVPCLGSAVAPKLVFT
jgi:hypothetical protein